MTLIRAILHLAIVISVCSYSGYNRRKQIFSQTVQQLKERGKCFWNYELIGQYMRMLKQNKIGAKVNRLQFKGEMDGFLNELNYEKVWEREYDNKYKICIHADPFLNLRIPNKNLSSTPNLTVNSVFGTYLYLITRLSHRKISEALNQLPLELKNTLRVARYIILDGQIYMETYPQSNFIWNRVDHIIRKLGPLPDMDFVLYSRSQVHPKFIMQIMDYNLWNSHIIFDGNVELYKKIIIELPAFMMSKDLKGELEFNKLLIVDSEIAQFPWDNAIKEVEEGAQMHGWQTKIEKGFWRGEAIGRSYDEVNFWKNVSLYFPRLSLVDLSSKNPSLLDAKFTTQEQLQPKKMRAYNISIGFDSLPRIRDHLMYKYLINVDGWTANWLTLPWMLRSNSVVVKQQSSRVQWFYHELKPGVHYIAMKWDVSDAYQRIQYLKSHDEIAKNVSKAANAFVLQNLGPQKIQQKLLETLLDYARVQQLEIGFIQRMVLKHKEFFEMSVRCIILLLLVLSAWQFIRVCPSIYSYFKSTFVWRGLRAFFVENPSEYEQVSPA